MQAALSMLHPDIRDAAAVLKRLGESAIELGGAPLRHSLEWAGDNAGLQVLKLLTRHGPGIYSLPMLDPAFCAELVAMGERLGYEVNPHEEAPYQIPEVFLKAQDEQAFIVLRELAATVMVPAAQVLFRLTPATLTSAQLARYTPENTAHGNWHHDRDSDITAVVAISNSHAGGGTSATPPGLGRPVYVPSLPVGHAMLFLGRTTIHRGEPVTSGTRNLCVFWSTVE